MIGIIICDPTEFRSLDLKNFTKLKEGNFNIYKYNEKSTPLVIIESKIGLIQAAAATQTLLLKYKEIELIINLGAVGANKANLKIYDLVIPEKIFYHGVTTPWYKYGQIPLQKEFFTNSLKIENVKNNNLASSLKFINNINEFKELKKIKVDIVDMEAAAIANIASNFNVPCQIVKCVSDIVGITDTSQLEEIDTRIEKAGAKAFNFVWNLIH